MHVSIKRQVCSAVQYSTVHSPKKNENTAHGVLLILYLHDEVVEVWWQFPIGRQEVRLRPDRPPTCDQEKQAQHESGDENPLHHQLRLRRNYLGITRVGIFFVTAGDSEITPHLIDYTSTAVAMLVS